MSHTSTSQALSGLPFLRGLPSTLLWHLARSADARTLEPGEYLFRAGEERSVLGIIIGGGLSIEQEHEGKPVQIIALGEGEVVGEGILLEAGNHGSSGRATQQTELLVFRKEPLLKLLKDQPALYAALLGRAAKIINDRIRGANATLLGVRSDAMKVRADVELWFDAVKALAVDVGYERALDAARAALRSGGNPASLTSSTGGDAV